MRKKEDNLKTLLQREAKNQSNSREKLQETIFLCQKAIWEIQRNQEISAFEFIWYQARFIAKETWIAQAAIFAGMLFCIFVWDIHSRLEMDLLITVAAPMMILFAVPEMWKNIRYRAIDVEACTKFGLKKSYLARFILLGMTNLCMVTVLVILESRLFQMPMYEFSIRFLVPYNSTLMLCFFVMSRKRQVSEYMIVGSGVLWTAVLCWLTKHFCIYENVQMTIWCGLIVLSCFYIFWMSKKIFRNFQYKLEANYVRN